MKYIDEFRSRTLVKALVDRIHSGSKKKIRLMEVCGGHTMAIQRFGLPSLLPDNIELISGPGCPVCVTDKRYIDRAVKAASTLQCIITTYGDLLRVPGSSSTLEKERGKGADVRIITSPLESLEIASKSPGKTVVFLAIGFETTSPATAVTIQEAARQGLKNFHILSAHKVMPPAMKALIDDGVKLNGYICPGHVSAITGSGMYESIVNDYRLGCVISGFEPVDLLQTILMLVEQLKNNQPKLEIQYKRAVRPEGNIKALGLLNEVFESTDDWWRGLGVIPGSGLGLRPLYHQFDAILNLDLEVPDPADDKACICGLILKGLKSPLDCKLFGKACVPENPVGACMVSSEGSCQAYYRYHGNK